MTVSSFIRPVLHATSLLLLAAGLTQCTTKKSTPAVAARGGYYDVPAKRPNNPAAVRVHVSTGTQRVYVTEGDRMLLVTACCVGTASDPTPKGNFRVTNKIANKRRISSPGAGYPMPNWVEFKPAYGFHGGWIHPYPASHGCVRLPWKVSSKFFNLVRPGTPINIATSQPYDAKYAHTVTQPDERPTPEWPAGMLNSTQIFAHSGPGHLE
jgi:lipoprotein-anchoring transpeptidase ErfK/SrfK